MLLAAGGTGGHLFPAEALAAALGRRGIVVDLATDDRAERYGDDVSGARASTSSRARRCAARDPVVAGAHRRRCSASARCRRWRLLGRIGPAASSASAAIRPCRRCWRRRCASIPTLIHEQNAVMGRANRLLAPRVERDRHQLSGVLDREPGARRQGDAHRQSGAAGGDRGGGDALCALRNPAARSVSLVFGGSQGARIMADIVPAAIERLDPRSAARGSRSCSRRARRTSARVTRHLCAGSGRGRGRAVLHRSAGADRGRRISSLSRSGASTVAELAAIGRPAILVPLPHALDQDQSANAGVLEAAGRRCACGRTTSRPSGWRPKSVALASAPEKLVAMAAAARSQGALDAAERLADLRGCDDAKGRRA